MTEIGGFEFWLILLALLILPYLVHGYIVVYWLAHVGPVKKFLSKSWFLKLSYAVLVFLFPVGTVLTIALDVLLFISDLGFRIPFIEHHANLAEYQLFRDMGRALFGTLPTLMLQSYVLTLLATPDNDTGIAGTNIFVLSFVGAGLQLLKVLGETLYLALSNKRGVFKTFWHSLVGTMVPLSRAKEPLNRKTSEMLFLPQQQPRSPIDNGDDHDC